VEPTKTVAKSVKETVMLEIIPSCAVDAVGSPVKLRKGEIKGFTKKEADILLGYVFEGAAVTQIVKDGIA